MFLTLNIYEPNGVSNWGSLNTLVIEAGGLSINGITNGIPSEFMITEVEGEAIVSVSKEGYYPYSGKLNVCEDTVIPIVLVPKETNSASPYFNRPFPFSYSIQDCCKKEVTIYNVSSFGGEREVYIDDKFCTTADVYKTCMTVGLHQITTRGTTYEQSCGCNGEKEPRYTVFQALSIVKNDVIGVFESVDYYLGLDDIANFEVFETSPSFSISLVSDCPECCVPYDVPASVELSYTLPQFGPGQLEENWEVTWSIKDNTDTLTTPLAELSPFSFNVEKAKSYEVTATMTNTVCNTSYKQTIIVNSCVPYTIEGKCGEYTITNSMEEDLSVQVRDYKGDALDIEDFVVGKGEIVQLTLPIGLFIVGLNEEITIVENHCALEDCMAAYITNVLCVDEGCNCEYDISTELQAMRNIMLSYTYFMQINKFQPIGYFYTALDESLMSSLFNAQQVLDKIIKQCERMGCKTSTDCGCSGAKVVNITKGTTNCGCHG